MRKFIHDIKNKLWWSAEYEYPVPVTKDILKKNKLLAFNKETSPEVRGRVWPFYVDKSPISHNKENNSYWAIDFLVPVSTDILAVQDGKVWVIKEDSNEHWRGSDFGDKANYIIILHDNNMMSEYIHLDKWSVSELWLKPWDSVKKWQKIWKTWLSGWIDIPHLHFALYKNTRGTVHNVQIDFWRRIMTNFLSRK